MSEFVVEILDGDRAGETIALGPTKLTIGRKPGNTLVLKDEKSSGTHAEIVFEEGGYLLRDLDSTNGTLLDGKRIAEVVLTPGDRFQIGRTHLLFRAATAAAAGTGDELKLRRLDASALGRAGGRRGLGLMVAALVLLAGGAAWFWLRDESGPLLQRGPQRRAPLVIPGNRLPDAVAQGEGIEEWQTTAGAPFDVEAPGHTGQSALTATRPDAAAPAFAVARAQTDLPVRAGDRLQLAARMRSEAGGLGGIRVAFASSQDAGRVPLVTGTALAASDDFTEVAAQIAAPAGYDRMRVELVALLPEAGARVQLDDLAITDGGAAERQDLSVAGRALAHCGASFALLGTEAPILAHGRPIDPGGAFAPLAAAGLLVASDLGLALAITPNAEGFELALTGGDAAAGFELQFAAGFDRGTILTRSDDPVFTARGDEFDLPNVRELLLGGAADRLLVTAPAPVRCLARMRQRQLWLRFGDPAGPCPKLALRLLFRAERGAAQEQIRAARAAAAPKEALAQLRRVLLELPHDGETQRQAQALRSELLGRYQLRFDELRAELDQVRFFDSAVGWRRLQAAVGRLVAEFGTTDLPEIEGLDAMRAEIDGRLATLADEERAAQRVKLQGLLGVLDESEQHRLAKLVRQYLEGQ
jgi:hypothetical protein